MNLTRVVVTTVVSCLVSNRYALAEDYALASSGNDVLATLDAACIQIRSDTTLASAAAQKKAKPASAPVFDYCFAHAWPESFFDAGYNPKADTIAAAFSALSHPLDGALTTTAITTNGGVPALGGIADLMVRGLATVMMKRANAELQNYIVSAIRDDICSNDSIRVFVENTCSYLGAESESIAATLGPALRAAVIADVAALPRKAVAKIPANGTAAGLLARVTFQTVTTVVERADLRLLASSIGVTANGWSCTQTDLKCSKLKSELVATVKALNVVVLIAEQIRAKESAEHTLPEAAYKELLTLFSSGLSKVAGRTISDDEAREFFDAVRIAMSAGRAWLAATAETRRQTAGQMLRAILGVLDSALRLNSVDVETMPELNQLAEEATAMAEAVGSADLGSVYTLVVTQIRRMGVPAGFDKASRILALGVELASAKTADEVSATIEAVAAPMGSYKRKFFSPSRTIGGFVGFAIGYDKVSDNDKVPTARSFGPIGLVGVDFTWPIKQRVAAGFMVSLFDLGAVFASQKEEGMDVTESEGASPAIEQLVALGVHGRLSSSYTGPIVLHGGIGYVPRYRVVNGDERDVFRFLIGASVDVSLFPF